ncbi:MAG: hypothetical protein NTW21_42510 [Verrucomicrobia bacterium]|nr:hypothetical protein [Verrucomicrobiota bacterium]
MLEAISSAKSVSLWSSLTANLNSFARDSRLAQRLSKHFSPQEFLLSLLEAVSTGRASLNQLVACIGYDVECFKLSPQALHHRINRTECGVEGFLARCLSHICQWKFLSTRPTGALPFGRIIIEDSTFVRFPEGNAEELNVKGCQWLHPIFKTATGCPVARR